MGVWATRPGQPLRSTEVVAEGVAESRIDSEEKGPWVSIAV
jgi:hypothetical protein